MSIHQKANGKWTVRWRDGQRNRSATFDTKREAEAFDAEERERPSPDDVLIRKMILQAMQAEEQCDGPEGLRQLADWSESMFSDTGVSAPATKRGAEIVECFAWALRARADQKEAVTA